MTQLSRSLVFLHGASGAGKGEMSRQLSRVFAVHDVRVISVSSGDLFREASHDPIIGADMRAGKYIDTLDAIIPGLQAKYREFLEAYFESGGRAVFVLDGLIRRSDFTRPDGTAVPSQVEQIARAFQAVNDEMVARYPELRNMDAREEVVAARHIVVDVAPQDAEAQMRRRAREELAEIRGQIEQQYHEGNIRMRMQRVLLMRVSQLGTLLSANTHLRDLEALSERTHRILAGLAADVGAEGSSNLRQSFAQVGIRTVLRDDDVNPKSRWQRVQNYTQLGFERDSGPHALWRRPVIQYRYSPGDAARALIKDLGFVFSDEDGHMKPTHEGSLVILNGATRGIGLEAFRSRCAETAEELYRDAHPGDLGRELNLPHQ